MKGPCFSTARDVVWRHPRENPTRKISIIYHSNETLLYNKFNFKNAHQQTKQTDCAKSKKKSENTIKTENIENVST
jgi:hypothetical protein